MSAEDDLVRRLVRDPSDLSLWAALYDLLQPHLRFFTLSLVRQSRALDASEAEDIVQEVLVGFLKNFDSLRSDLGGFAHVRNYLIKACRNRFLNRVKQASIREGAYELLFFRFSEMTSELLQKEFRSVENQKLLEALLADLSEECREMAHAYLV